MIMELDGSYFFFSFLGGWVGACLSMGNKEVVRAIQTLLHVEMQCIVIIFSGNEHQYQGSLLTKLFFTFSVLKNST